MKLSLRLIPILAIAITIVTFVVASNQVHSEKKALRADAQRRAEILAESLQESLEPALQTSSMGEVHRIVERFGNREHLVGIAVFDHSGKPLAVAPKLAKFAQDPPDVFPLAENQDHGVGSFEKVESSPMYVYAVPLHAGAQMAGVLVLYNDGSYIEAQSTQIWRDAIWHVVAQVILIVLITFFVIRWTITRQIAKVAQWMKDLRSGKSVPPPQSVDGDILQPLSAEATNLAQNLAEARATAQEEARLREVGDSLWTADRLRASMHRRVHGNSLVVISNREPYHHVHGSKGIEVRVPASGLVTALEPILNACNGTWIAHGSADADRETVDANDRLPVPPDHPHYTLRRVWLSKEEEDGYYMGFANEGIWPLCHIAFTRPTFRASDWDFYQRVNEKFAGATLEELADVEHPYVLIQDYHFALLPRLIKARRPDARVAIFWHIPWPNPEAFGICPWQRELLDGLLGADLIGFHVQSHCNNFLETVDQALECRIEWDRFTVNRNDHFSAVRPHPISVAPPDSEQTRMMLRQEPDRASILAKLGPDVECLGVGVDRIDYTKGILERFRGIESFLDNNPRYRGQFAFVQFGAPSRTHIKRYQDFVTEVQAEAERVNRRFQDDKWKPIVLLSRHHSHEEIEPYYRAADFCMVTSLHDGMNLVAKEFVASRDDRDGVLILSKFTGAARELRDALLVNPYDTEQLAATIRRALEMPTEERRARMDRMRREVKEHNVYRWAAELISELAELRLDTPEAVESSLKVVAR